MLHDQEVKVICHDALFMAQLQTEIARKYGTESCVININGHQLFVIYVLVSLILMVT